MKKLPILFLAATIAFAACKKETAKCIYSSPTAVAPVAEADSIQRYLTANGLSATRDASGIFYNVSPVGAGATPEVCSYLSVQYEGTLFNGTRFDGTTGAETAQFTLGGTIVGWQRAIPFVKPGGSITFYIPPSLGYGAQERRDPISNLVIIPANSYLKFTVSLISVQ